MARTQVCKRVYAYGEGEGRSAKPDTKSLTFAFTDGSTVAIKLDDFPKDVLTCAMWHGLNQKLGDSFAGAKGDPSKAEESFMEVFEALKTGTWVAEGESAGPRVSQLAQAILAAKQAAGDTKVTIEDITAKCQDADYRKKAATVPQVKAELEAIKAKAAQERAKKAAAEAKQSQGDVATL